MGTTRLQFETTVAYWKKVHKSNGHIQYFRIGKDTGLARAKEQTSFAAAKTHKIAPEDKRESGHTFAFEQIDQTPGLSKIKYTDGVRVGYVINPPINFDDITEGLRPNEFTSLGDVYSYINKRYRNMHKMRKGYHGVYWKMTYKIVRENMVDNVYWNSGMYPPENDWIYWESGEGSLKELWDNLTKAYSTYKNVIIQSIGVHFRKGDLNL